METSMRNSKKNKKMNKLLWKEMKKNKMFWSDPFWMTKQKDLPEWVPLTNPLFIQSIMCIKLEACMFLCKYIIIDVCDKYWTMHPERFMYLHSEFTTKCLENTVENGYGLQVPP